MKKPNNSANDSVLQFTLREMQRFVTSQKFWASIAAITVILGVSGPFSTLKELSVVPRFAYWGCICVFTFFANLAVVIPTIKVLLHRSTPKLFAYALAGIVGSFPVTLVVWFLSAYLAGNVEPTLRDLFGLWTQCAPIAIAITMSNLVFLKANTETENKTSDLEPIFFKRLSAQLGKNIYSLQAQDHYIQVTTAHGKEMILMRLEDAIKELEGLDGMQVHRSWWVAKNGVLKLTRENGKTSIILKDENKIPVSRTYVKATREMFPAL